MGFNLNIHDGTNTSQVSQTEINEYAVFYGLNRIARTRFSSLFVVNLMLLECVNGVDPMGVIEGIRVLEGIRVSLQTIPEAEFRGKKRRGLWHRHFMPSLPCAFETLYLYCIKG